jgi:ribosomal protein S18 acetylase RimI-like enzyme
MICKLANVDFKAILTVVNDASTVYKGKIPADMWKIPYMPAQELKEEIQRGVQFYGLKEKDELIAVMGMQRVNDVTLIRHAYVLTSYQRIGLGEKLLNHLISLVQTSKVYVGTWKAAAWAIRFYEKHGFQLISEEEKNKLLKKYWCIPERQIETSVVLDLLRK